MAEHKMSQYRSLRDSYTMNPEIAALWPDVSGNSINGLDEATASRP